MKHKILALCLSLIFLQQAFAQLTYEVFTDKDTYEYGETIVFTGRIYNNSDSTITFISGHDGFITPYLFNDAYLWEAVLPTEVPYALAARSYYTNQYLLEPQSIGLPNKDGINRIISNVYWWFYPNFQGFSSTDTVEFNAHAYYGGQIRVQFSNDTLNNMDALRDSINAEVLESDTSSAGDMIWERWQITGFLVDSIVTQYSNDKRIQEINVYRDIRDFSSRFVTNITEEIAQPSQYKLYQNYPNPFNPETMINYQLAMTNNVKLSVYDVTGREIKTLVNKIQMAGIYKVTFDGSDLSSGIYYYQLKTHDFTQTKKMIFIR